MSPLHHHFELGGWAGDEGDAYVLDCFGARFARRCGADAMNERRDVRRAASRSSSSASGVAGSQAARCCARAVRPSMRPTRENPNCSPPRSQRSSAIGASFVAPERDRYDCAGADVGGPFSRRPAQWRARAPGAGRAASRSISEIEVAYRICAAPIVAVTGTKGKTTTTALDRRALRARRPVDARRREYRQRADCGDRRRGARRLGDRRSFVVPTRVDPVVQAAHQRDPERHARSSRPIPFDGRVYRSKIPDLRESEAGRYVRRQPRRPGRRFARRPEGAKRASAPARSGSAGPRTASTALYVRDERDRVRAADRRSAPGRNHAASPRSRCAARTTSRT